MYSDIIKKIITLLSSNISMQCFNLLSLYILMKALTISDYGIYSYITEMVMIFSMIVESGTRSFYIRKIRLSENKEIELNEINSIHFILSIISFSILLLVSFISNVDICLYILVGFGYILSTIFVPIQSYFLAREKTKIIAVREQLIGISRLIYFFIGYYFSFDVIYFLLYIYIQFILMTVFWLIISKYNDNLLRYKRITKNNLSVIFEIIPFSILIVINLLYNKIDIYMLQAILGFKDVGVYTAATKMVYPFMFLSGVFMTAVFPRMVKSYNKEQNVLIFSITILPIVGVLLAVFLLFISDYLFIHLWDGKYLSSLETYRVMVLYLPIVFTYGVITNYLVAHNKIKDLCIINSFGLVLNVFINYSIIPIYGSLGAAISTILCEMIILVSLFFYVRFFLNIRIGLYRNLFFMFFVLIIGFYVFTNFK